MCLKFPFSELTQNPIFPSTDITLRACLRQKGSTSHLELLGRGREGIWGQKSGLKLQEVDFWKDFGKIWIFMKIDIFHAHNTDTTRTPTPATIQPET